MAHRIESLHHVTATAAEAQEDLDFYTRVLGLRLVKKTVNFDFPGVYHFYYGDARGRPGTIMTTFPYGGKGVRAGMKGAGQVTATAFSVPAGTLGFWKEWLVRHGFAIDASERRFGEELVRLEDPSGLVTELVAADDPRPAWTTEGLDADHAVRGVHSVTLTLRDRGPTRELLTGVLGLTLVGEEDGRTRIAAGDGAPGRILDLLHRPDAPQSVNGIGTVHHVALAIGSEEEQAALREELLRLGLSVTDVRDRQYFRSIYFREPGGVLLEIATAGPGFLVDEDEASLGRALKLPPWEEANRAEIERALPPVTT